MPILVILFVAAAFTKAIFGHRERMEYARQGLPHPKQVAKAAKGGAAGGGSASTANPDEGFGSYARTLWNDLWDDAKRRHDRERQARDAKHGAGGKTVGEQWEADRETFKKWWTWFMTGGKGNPEELPGGADPDEAKPDPAKPDPADAEGPEGTKPEDHSTRNCPECGEQLIEDVDGWWHRGRQPCPKTGRPDPYKGPQPPDPGSSSTPPPPPPDPSGQSAPPPPPDPDTTQEIPPQPQAEPASSAAPPPPPPPDPKPYGAPCPVCQFLLNPDGSHGTRDGVCPGPPGSSKPAEPQGSSSCSRCHQPLDERGFHLNSTSCPADATAQPPHPSEPEEDDPWKPLSEQEKDEMRRNALHDVGKWCGDPNCSCACTQCHAEPQHVAGIGERCMNANAHRRTYGANSPDCVRCGSYDVIYATNYSPPAWVCRACWAVQTGPEPITEADQKAAELEEEARNVGLPVTEEPAATTGEEDQTPSPAGTAGPENSTAPHNGNATAGGTTMALEFNYDAIVHAHDDMLAKLNRRLEAALSVKNHATAAAAAADGMDNERTELISSAQALVEGMTEARFDANSVAGATEAASAFSADDAAAIEEQCQELVSKADSVISVTNQAIEQVQASRDHIVNTYGALAEGVQSTGVRGEAMEAN
jgi:hypothetical protein